MSFFDSALTFIEGIKSVVDVTRIVQGTISDATSNGIESAFKRVKKPLERSIMKISCVLMSLFLLIWGLSIALDSFLIYHGLGFIIVGALFGTVILFLFKENETCVN